MPLLLPLSRLCHHQPPGNPPAQQLRRVHPGGFPVSPEHRGPHPQRPDDPRGGRLAQPGDDGKGVARNELPVGVGARRTLALRRVAVSDRRPSPRQRPRYELRVVSRRVQGLARLNAIKICELDVPTDQRD